MTWVLLIHWLHVLSGIIWFGGYVFMAFGVWPALLRRPAAEARATLEAVDKFVGPLMMTSGTLVFWLGVVRGTWLGPIKDLEYLFGSSYGLTFLLALLLTLVISVYGAVSSRNLYEKVWNKDQFTPTAAQYIRNSNLASLSGLMVVLVCMVLMRFGL